MSNKRCNHSRRSKRRQKRVRSRTGRQTSSSTILHRRHNRSSNRQRNSKNSRRRSRRNILRHISRIQVSRRFPRIQGPRRNLFIQMTTPFMCKRTRRISHKCRSRSSRRSYNKRQTGGTRATTRPTGINYVFH